PNPGENFIDCTVGAGGHSLAILEKNSPGKVLAIDWDKESLQLLKLKV
ncbi:16S rRNA (cytosine(1402)-N(4))-methyltransferase, partial [Candidatus Berkelbacteria bacterium CG10_big_fil_rev_8_21_14_0_10_41_12]